MRTHLKGAYRSGNRQDGGYSGGYSNDSSGPRQVQTPAKTKAKTKVTGGPQRRRRASKVPPAHQAAAAAAPEETLTLGHRMLHGMASAAATLVRPLWAAPPSTFEHTGLALRRAVSLNAVHCIHTRSSFSPDLRCCVGLDTSDVSNISRQPHSASVLSPAAIGKSVDKAPTPERKGKGRMQKRRRGKGGRGGGVAAAAVAPAAAAAEGT